MEESGESIKVAPIEKEINRNGGCIMAFCINCGQELAEGAKFCGNCGKAVSGNHSMVQREIVYEGKVYKCPNCGEMLNSFVTICPTCEYELRGVTASNSVNEFVHKLELARTKRQTLTLIKSFPIPNTKEDVYEHMIIAASNITGSLGQELFDAWKLRFEQSYQKAKLLLKNDSSLFDLQEIYEKTKKKIRKIESSRNAKTVSSAVGRGGKTIGRGLLKGINTLFEMFERVLRKNARALPNMVICAAWIISLHILIPLCDGYKGDDYCAIIFFDLVAGVIFIPFATRSKNPIPALIVAIGLVATIAKLIPLCRGLSGDDYVAILFFEIVATVIIVVRMFKKNRE